MLRWKQLRPNAHAAGLMPRPMAADGDPDPINAGTAGEAALWGGSIAVVGMAANPFGAHQADPYVSCAPGCHRNRARFGVRGQRSGVRGRVLIRSDVFQNSKARRCAVRDATWAATTHRHPFSQPEFGHDWKLKQSQLRQCDARPLSSHALAGLSRRLE